MKEERQERLFRAIGDVGADLIDMAEKQTFAPSRWRKWGSLAACLAVILCLGVLALPYFPSGCGSSSKETAAPGYAGSQKEIAAEAPEMEAPAEAEPETADVTEGAAEAFDEAAVRTRFVFRYTYYYLTDQEPSPLDDPPSVLGELLGQVEECEDEALVGCPVYRYLNTTEYDNHSVNGLTVPAEVWVEMEDGFHYAVTLNEKTVSRYTLDDVMAHLEADDGDWIVETLVEPLYEMDDFNSPSGLTGEQLNEILLRTSGMNTGVNASNIWLDDTGVYVIPADEARWRLRRFLDADSYTYVPEKTAAYLKAREALEFEYLLDTSIHSGMLYLDQAEILDGDTLLLQVSSYEAGTSPASGAEPLSTREFVLRFDEDSWRYLSIQTIGSVG